MKRFFRIFVLLIVVLVVAYFAGPIFPKPELKKDLPKLEISDYDQYVKVYDSGIKIKPDNGSRVIWANDSLKNKTEYCLLYLHGFSASWFEGEPVHRDFARRYGMNLYIPLLAAHGIDTPDPLIDMTPDKLYESAKEALVAAQTLGNKVILMSTSTGGTLSLKLAADFPDLVSGLFLYSPNIAINNGAAFLLSKHWGLQIARAVSHGKYRVTNPDSTAEECKYWYCKYRLEGVVHLQQLVEATMTKETFAKVTQPVFLGYYYKDEEHQDPTVRVDAMLNMFDELGTPEKLKEKVSFPEAECHPIASKLFSKSWQELEQANYKFAEEKLGLIPILNEKE